MSKILIDAYPTDCGDCPCFRDKGDICPFNDTHGNCFNRFLVISNSAEWLPSTNPEGFRNFICSNCGAEMPYVTTSLDTHDWKEANKYCWSCGSAMLF